MRFNLTCKQCDQRLGDFLKFLATRFLAKEAQNYWQLLGYFEKPYSFVKTALATFWATFGKIGLLFTPTSGHTGIGTKKSFAKIKILFLLLVGVREGELGR